jgi:2-polyprenyl-6-methoxyphenol hydroxylase-like FAD-dependent oxidoreductase
VPYKTSVPLSPWETTSVTLLGDAIHNMTPMAGLGGNMALRDASFLCRHLVAVARGRSELLPALHAYEAAMIDYGFAAVRTSLRYTEQAISGNRLAPEGTKLFFRVCGALPPLRRAVFGSRWSEREDRDSRAAEAVAS